MAEQPAGEESESGISRMSISGLFDARGNPAALASGWLQLSDKNGRKRHRYFCLTPTTLSWFQDEADAEISEEGFMEGDADHAALSTFANHGACVQLSNIYAAEPHAHEPQFTLVLREGLDDGTQAMILFAANPLIAGGWSDAINSQKERYKDVRAPPRVPKEGSGAGGAGGAGDGSGAAALMAAASMASVAGQNMVNMVLPAAAGAGKHAKAAVFGLFGMKTGDEIVRPDDDYLAAAPWEAKGIDLTQRETRSCLEDEHGHPAAILHGWLTKKNKSGIYAGSVEKERYFVLTPSALCFFPDDELADIRNGYMWGKAEGERIGGIFTKTGARLPLESVCEVRLLSKDGKHHPASPTAGGRGGRRGGGDGDDDDDEDGDGDDDDDEDGASGKGGKGAKKPKKPSGPKPSGAKPVGKKPKGGDAGGGGGGGGAKSPSKPAGPPPSTLVEVDFGEYSLVINAHNPKCRTTWVHGLRKWSGIRKRVVDEELFTGGGGGGF